MSKFEVISKSCEETENLGEKFSRHLKGNEVIAMFGGMGMGKTSFVRGIAKGLGLNDDVSSPTFSLINEYTSGNFPVYHFDMYRVVNWEGLYSTGFFDYVENGVLLIEWSENIEKFLPENSIRISISRGNNDDERIFKFNFKGDYNENTCN